MATGQRGKVKNLATFWQPVGTYILNMAISEAFFPLKTGDFVPGSPSSFQLTFPPSWHLTGSLHSEYLVLWNHFEPNPVPTFVKRKRNQNQRTVSSGYFKNFKNLKEPTSFHEQTSKGPAVIKTVILFSQEIGVL